MLLRLAHVLDAPTLAAWRTRLDGATWIDGRATAGHQSARVKHNAQIDADDPLAIEFGEMLAARLGALPDFVSAALPRRIYPPMLSRYRAGGDDRFGTHVDNAIRYDRRGTMRADLSATVFLSDPEDYDGGELVIEDSFGPRAIRLAAGDMVLYPASSLHSVNGLTRGTRLAAVFWVQSMVRDPTIRDTLHALDGTIRGLATDLPEDPRILALTNVYHNLVRHHAEP